MVINQTVLLAAEMSSTDMNSQNLKKNPDLNNQKYHIVLLDSCKLTADSKREREGNKFTTEVYGSNFQYFISLLRVTSSKGKRKIKATFC